MEKLIEEPTWRDSLPGPMGEFDDTEEAVMALVNQLYDSEDLDKRVIHNALWWLCLNYGEKSNEGRLDYQGPDDLVIEHWRTKSILTHNA